MRLRIYLGAITAITAIAGAMLATASAQPPTSVVSGEGIPADQIGRTLLDPKFCGTPAPEGYACALLYYEDAKARDALIPKAQVAKSYYRLVLAAKPPKKEGDPADLTVLSPDGRTVHITAKQAQSESVADATKRSHRTIVRSIAGYQDNERRPIGDNRKIDRTSFLKPKPLAVTGH